MNNKTFPFSYDQAAAFFNKDLWNSDTSLPISTRTSVAGFAYVGGICGLYRYSIQEEFGGFQYVNVVSHEIGHK